MLHHRQCVLQHNLVRHGGAYEDFPPLVARFVLYIEIDKDEKVDIDIKNLANQGEEEAIILFPIKLGLLYLYESRAIR